MTTKPKRRSAVALLLVTGVACAGVLAGCGGDEGGESAATQETATEESGSTTGADATASLEGSIMAEFTVTSCTNEGETDLVLEAERDSYTLSVDAPDGTGTITYTGGDEEDGADESGAVSSVTVGDAGDFTVEGTWDSDGEAFTLTGNCRL